MNESEIEALLARWDAVRARSGLDTAASSWERAAGFPRRLLTRIRDLGASWDRQRDLFRALIDRQAALDQRLLAMDQRLLAMDQRLLAMDDRLLATGGERSALAGELAELRSLLSEQSAELQRLQEKREVQREVPAKQAQREAPAAVTGRIGDFLGAINEIRVILTTLRDRQESLRVRQSRLEMGALRERLPGAPGPAESSVPLTPRDVADLLLQLEADVPPESRPGAVEVSLQDARAEDLLLAARRHFGGRMSSAGPRYRAPNDLWVHVDFTADWSRPVLLENAAARLQPGGRFLLITAPGHGEAPRHPQLAPEEDRGLSVPSGGTVRVIGWRR